jgi:hypothetical protein
MHEFMPDADVHSLLEFHSLTAFEQGMAEGLDR